MGANSALYSLCLSQIFGGEGASVHRSRVPKTRLGFSKHNGRHNGKRFTFLPQFCPFLDLLTVTFYILCPFRYGLKP